MRRVAAALFLTLGAAACGDKPTDPADVGMRVTVSVSQSVASVGDTVAVAVSATNVTGSALDLDFLGPCTVGFEVVDAAGTLVAPLPPVCPIIDWVPTLDAGAAIGLTFEWRGERQWGVGNYLPAGTYRIRGVLDTRDGPLRGAPTTFELRAAP